MSNDLTPAQIEEQRKVDEAKYQSEVLQQAALYPNYTVKEFTFTQLERTQMAEQDTIVALATQAKEKIINLYCLARVGVRFSRDVKVLYSIGLGRFTCLLPKEVKPTEKETPAATEKTSTSPKG